MREEWRTILVSCWAVGWVGVPFTTSGTLKKSRFVWEVIIYLWHANFVCFCYIQDGRDIGHRAVGSGEVWLEIQIWKSWAPGWSLNSRDESSNERIWRKWEAKGAAAAPWGLLTYKLWAETTEPTEKEDQAHLRGRRKTERGRWFHLTRAGKNLRKEEYPLHQVLTWWWGLRSIQWVQWQLIMAVLRENGIKASVWLGFI